MIARRRLAAAGIFKKTPFFFFMSFQALLAAGFADLTTTLGQGCTLTRGGSVYWSGAATLVQTSGGYAVEWGGSMISLAARAQVPASAPEPRGGDILTSGSRQYIVVGVVKSDFDVCFNLDLATLK